MRSEVAQIFLYLLVLKVSVGGISVYVASKRQVLDFRTFFVISFVPWLSILFVALKKKSAGDGVSIGVWLYIAVTLVEMTIISILRTLPTSSV